MTETELSSIAGIVLSLAFSYVPGLKGSYEKLSGDYKRLVMAALLLVTAGVVLGLSCTGVLANVECTQASALGLLKVFIAAMIANQGTYLLTKS